MWRQTIEREDEHVAPADVATAELGKRVAQTLVFPLHDFQGHVGYNHAATSSRFSFSSGHAIKVDPVVPVKRTRRYVPIHSGGPSSIAILLVRVRACSKSPRFAGPSTRTSCVVPTSPMFFRLAMCRTSAMSRPIRSVWVSAAT